MAFSNIAVAEDTLKPPSPKDREATSIIEARIENGLLTLHPDGASLADVLRAIGEAGAFSVQILGELDASVGVSFIDHPVERALRQLVDEHALIIVRKEADAHQLAEIRVVQERYAVRHRVDEDTSGETEPPKEIVSEERMDRGTFRETRQGMPEPTKDDVLIELSDSDQTLRIAAVPKVGSLRPRQAIEVISHVFSNNDDLIVRSRAVATLARLGGGGARGLLRDRALSDDDAELRAQALNGLASSWGERAINVLGQALRQDPEPMVRVAAIRALERIGGDWANRLLTRASRDTDPQISFAAEKALAGWSDDD